MLNHMDLRSDTGQLLRVRSRSNDAANERVLVGRIETTDDQTLTFIKKKSRERERERESNSILSNDDAHHYFVSDDDRSL